MEILIQNHQLIDFRIEENYRVLFIAIEKLNLKVIKLLMGRVSELRIDLTELKDPKSGRGCLHLLID